MNSKNHSIIIWTDGACRGNGREYNIGAWGAILQFGNQTKEISGIALNTTNNQMELQAVIEALKILKKKNISIEVISDSKYVINGITEWIHNWIIRDWVTSARKPVENKELWMELYDLKLRFKEIIFTHVEGHADCEGNIQVDKLLNDRMDQYVWHETIHEN